MPRVPRITKEPQNRSQPGVMPPRVSNFPCSQRSGMAKSASLARAVVPARSKTATDQIIGFRLFIAAATPFTAACPTNQIPYTDREDGRRSLPPGQNLPADVQAD